MPKRTVPAGEGKRIPVMARTTPEMRRRLEQAAAASGRSLGQEVEFRLTRDFNWEESRQNIAELTAKAEAAFDAANIQLVREAGLQIVHEGGDDQIVNVSVDLLLATADGIRKSGFIDPEAAALPERSLEAVVERAVRRALDAPKQKDAA